MRPVVNDIKKPLRRLCTETLDWEGGWIESLLKKEYYKNDQHQLHSFNISGCISPTSSENSAQLRYITGASQLAYQAILYSRYFHSLGS